MQILQPGFVPTRKKAADVINPPNPIKPQRLRVLKPCVLWTGAYGQPGDVIEVDRASAEGFELMALLTGHSDAGQKVPITTPLSTPEAAKKK